MPHQLLPILEFFDRGGPVFVVVLLTSILLWTLIIERYWFFFFIYPKKLEQIVNQWEQRTDHTSWYALRVREGLIADILIASKEYIVPIQTLISVLPLLGLLGTVTGMIAIFDVMNVFSTGNARGMASGISRALLPTTAGLVASLVGLYFSSDLIHRATTLTDQARDRLQV